MRRLVLLAGLLALAGCGEDERTLRGYGMSITLPPGWSGRIGHGLVFARGQGVSLRIDEWQLTPADGDVGWFLRPRFPIRTARSDFTARENALRFSLAGRYFVVFVHSKSPPSEAAVRATNGTLASFRARHGDFYGGRAEPARFPGRRGWYVGTGGADRLRAQGAFTRSFASTIPYRDPPNQLPPWRTLERLPRDGIVIWLGLWRYSRPIVLHRQGSFRIERRKVFTGFEGNPQQDRISLYRAVLPGRSYVQDLWVFFGTPHPGRCVVARAQAELDAVRLPRWPRG